MISWLQDVNQIDENKLTALIEGRVSERIDLEFKAQPYGPKSEDVREFLKDVSAMANTAGGLLLIGIGEADGVACKICPITLPSDATLQRLENLLQASVEPRIFGTQLRTIEVAGGYVIAISIPKSISAPHRVTSEKINRYYLRSSTNVYEASYSELRNMFLQAHTAAERFEAFRIERLQILYNNRGPMPLDTRLDRLILHIAPLAGSADRNPIDLERAISMSGAFAPLGNGSSYNPQINMDGLLNYRGGPACHGYTQLFRDGRIEATYVGVLSEDPIGFIFARRIENIIVQKFASYVRNLFDSGVYAPLVIGLSIAGVRGASVTTAKNTFEIYSTPAIQSDNILLPACMITDPGNDDSYLQALRPAWDVLWNAAGDVRWTPA